MSLDLEKLLAAPIINLDTIDSTNNYAMHRLDDVTSAPGTVVSANAQTAGKGQRGNRWEARPGSSLLMSAVLAPDVPLEQQFAFSAAVAVSVAEYLISLYPQWQVRIKWPNDIIVNDKKAAGILIENVIRGSHWTYAIVGVGMNLNQERMPEELPNATSLQMESGMAYDRMETMHALRYALLSGTRADAVQQALYRYNRLLFRRKERQTFGDGQQTWEGTVLEAMPNGQLKVLLDQDATARYHHGQVQWIW